MAHLPESGEGAGGEGSETSRPDEAGNFYPDLDQYGDIRYDPDGIMAAIDRLAEQSAEKEPAPTLSPVEIAARDAALVEDFQAWLERSGSEKNPYWVREENSRRDIADPEAGPPHPET